MLEIKPAESLTGDDEKNSHQPGFSYPMLELTDSEQLTGDDETNANKPNPEYCEICTLMANEARKFIRSHENVTEVKLAKWVNFFCDVFMEPEQATTCHNIVQKYGQAFVIVMVKDLNPEIVSCAYWNC